MIIVGVFLKSGSQIVHQSPGRNFHPPPGGVAFGEVVSPLVVGFPGDPAFPRKSFRNGLALVEKAGKLMYIDRSGTVVWEEK